MPSSLRVFSSARMGLMVEIQRSLSRTRALAVPFLEPGPFLLPLAFWPAAYLILALDVPFFGFALIRPDAMAVRMSARVMHSSTSSRRSGSIQTLFSPHFRMSAAILLWLLRSAMLTPSC